MTGEQAQHRADQPGSIPLVVDAAGVRVALVDSGVDPSHPWFGAAQIDHRRLVRDGAAGGYRAVPDEGGDRSGHGTACAGIILRMAPKVRLTSLRALGPDGRCSRDALIAALRYCIRERYPVVNLSLGIDVPRRSALKPTDHRPILALYELADAAYTASVLLVASGPNAAAFRTYPGRFKSLVGVGRGTFGDPEMLRSARTADYEILAPGTDVLAPALGGGERRWSGTSFACPFVTAHAARLIAAQPSLSVEAVKVALHGLAARFDQHDRAGP